MEVNEELKKVKKIRLVTVSDYMRIFCSNCQGYFDTQSKYSAFKCSLCGVMNTVKDDMIKKLKNVHTFDVTDLKIIEEGEGNFVMICNTDGDKKVQVGRVII